MTYSLSCQPQRSCAGGELDQAENHVGKLVGNDGSYHEQKYARGDYTLYG